MGRVHDYAKVAFDLIDDLDHLTEVDKVMSRVSATLADFGYTSFLITGVPEPPQRLEPYILLNGWPKGWTEQYTRSNYYMGRELAKMANDASLDLLAYLLSQVVLAADSLNASELAARPEDPPLRD
jgi:D-mannonate dehydratase